MKPGVKSSEFWLSFLSVLALAWLVTQGLEPKDAAEYVLVVTCGYIGQRWHLKTKNGNNYEEGKENPPPAPAAN